MTTTTPSETLGDNLYITQLDTDIGWFSVFGAGGEGGARLPATPFSVTMEGARAFGEKITRLALEKGALRSSLDPEATSYPILGHLIFTVRFSVPPKIDRRESVTRGQLLELLQSPSDASVTSYVPDWISPRERRYVLHGGYKHLQLVHVALVRSTPIEEHVAFGLYNAFANAGRLKLEHIHLIKQLLVDGNGRSYSPPDALPLVPFQSQAGGDESDPYYDQYVQYKIKYLVKKKLRDGRV